MSSIIKAFLLCLLPVFTIAQIDPNWGYVTARQADSLKRSVIDESNDTLKMAAFRSLGFYYQDFKLDSGLYFHEKQLNLAKKLTMKLWEADGYSQAAYVLTLSDNLIKSYEYFLEAEKIASNKKNESDNWRPWTFSNASNGHEARIAILGMNYQMISNLWGHLGESEKRNASLQEAVKLGESINNGKITYISSAVLAKIYSPDSVITMLKNSIDIAGKAGFYRVGNTYLEIAGIYMRNRIFDSALVYAQNSAETFREHNELIRLPSSYNLISAIFGSRKNNDSSLFYAKKSFNVAKLVGLESRLRLGYQSLANAYDLIDTDSAYKYERLARKLNDSLNNVRISSLAEYQKFSFNEQLRLKKLDEEKTAYANKMNMAGLIALMGGILLVAIIQYRNNRQKQKANTVLETTLTDLKSTQAQLVQSEKMASLGELTPGIAHEIQNPLNFVNNFAEVNTELGEEIRESLQRNDVKEAEQVLTMMVDNEQKILQHGKRADAIVKSMLLHSRANLGVKELTNINALADEYLRLAYHGLRAKDKTFQSDYSFTPDLGISKINLVPQDIGRVLLNLINNAFYAVREKKKQMGDGYEPMVTVSTKLIGPDNSSLPAGRQESRQSANPPIVIVSVADNGNGISEANRNKIFQPFFTTKPTGEGTGLGLSLSYDIVKAHGGEIMVESKEGEGTVFTVTLPIG